MRVSFVLAAALSFSPAFAADTDNIEAFEKRVRPLLASKCYSCHGPDKQFAALRLDSKAGILQGGQGGPAAVPGKPDESLLIKAVRHESLKMPLGGKLKPEEIAALETWVRQGLPWPEDKTQPGDGAGTPSFYTKLLREHWAFQPVPAVAVPPGAANPVDAFIRAKLNGVSLQPAAPASPPVLARRAAYVLTGLPPNPADLRQYLDNPTPAAYAAYVDKLLASPHFGEQWARHWMDIVRYAETYGYEWNFEIHGAWRYRDYLIRAFNNDVPYDQFVREHIAGDLLSKPRTRDNGRWNESVLGTAFFRLGEMGHDDCFQFRELRTDVVDNQIDTLTKAFQGLTVSCARCHDHKIDPIPTEDYYSLYGILNSSRPVTHTLNVQGPDPAVRSRLLDLKSEIRRQLGDAWLKETSTLARQLEAALNWDQDQPNGVQIAAGIDPLRINLLLKLIKREKLDLDDPLYPVARLAASKDWQQSWAELAKQYAKETSDREKFNREKFTPIGDFTRDVPAGWSIEGLGLREGRAASGDFAVATEGHTAVAGVFPAGLFTNLISDRLNGVLRSPLLPNDRKFVSLQVLGNKLGAQRTIVDHCVIGEDHRLLNNDSLTWLTVPTKGNQKLPVYVELNTKSDNPRLPERVEKFRGLKEEDYLSTRSYFGVTRAVLHDENVAPKAELAHMKRLLDGAAPASASALAQQFQNVVQDTLRAWQQGRTSDEDIVWIDWLIRELLITNSRNLTPALRDLTDRYRAAEAGLEEPAVVHAMGDYDRGADQPIFIGGQAKSLGRPAPRHFLTLMPDTLRQVGTEQSGRRELAEAMASPTNPLTSRVMVNRIWHYVFGRGLVATTDNFGNYGERPTHPELLDYLAAHFTEDGWSIKKTVRLLMLSNTFQQSSDPSPAARSADPQNTHWSRYPVRRLGAEEVRDSILAVSGRLDETLYGPSIQPHRDEPKAYRRLFQGPLDGDGRRSIYLKQTRMEGPRFLELFDQPPPLQTRGNRDVTNVPSQSLALLNDPFVVDQAGYWAKRLTERQDDAVDARLNRMFEQALGRPPRPEELARWQDLVQRLASQRGVAGSDVRTSEPVWRDVAHTFFNTKEFLYLR